MYVVIMHKHSFTQYQYLSNKIESNDTNYVVTDTAGGVHTFAKADYLIAIMS